MRKKLKTMTAPESPLETPLPTPIPGPLDQSEPIAGEKLPMWDSQQLLAGGVEALIHHGTETYRLRLTRYGKLLLQK